ncbi:33 kDa chaperonin [Candidatus Moduliflexus flocculans]|uniref:33 kDa chaperonin n=1 Tax=Candidatus Moduliflexus flocculans TaxID=1499966 RepID=A0A081BMH5_9BACT|nr:33 kDa chaperonin [Candidatus Moduliflexus flocculans]
MDDYLVRGVTAQKQSNLRGIACVTTRLVHEVCRQHDTSPTATVALGRALTAGALLSSLLKGDQRVALKFEGNGPLKKILVEANSAGNVRGYVGVPEVDLPLKQGKFDVARAIGRAGFLTVTKDLQMKEPYKGIVQLYTSEIAEDVAYYLTESEQIPSAMGISVFLEPSGDVALAGGFLLQSLPPADETVIASLIERIEQMPPLSEFFQAHHTPEALLQHLFRDIPFDIFEKHPLTFQCTCSKPRIERALISLGAEELTHIIAEEEQTEVVCEFCRAQYQFTRQELSAVLATIQ